MPHDLVYPRDNASVAHPALFTEALLILFLFVCFISSIVDMFETHFSLLCMNG